MARTGCAEAYYRYIKLARSLDGAKHDGAMGLDKGKIEQRIHEIDNLRLQLVRVTTEVSFCKIRTCCEFSVHRGAKSHSAAQHGFHGKDLE